jgi:hypothetical protein
VKDQKEAAEIEIKTKVKEKFGERKQTLVWKPFPHLTLPITRDEAQAIFDDLPTASQHLFATTGDLKLAGEGNNEVFMDYFKFNKITTHELYVRCMLLLEAHDLHTVGSSDFDRNSASTSFEDDDIKQVLKAIKEEVNSGDNMFNKRTRNIMAHLLTIYQDLESDIRAAEIGDEAEDETPSLSPKETIRRMIHIDEEGIASHASFIMAVTGLGAIVIGLGMGFYSGLTKGDDCGDDDGGAN